MSPSDIQAMERIADRFGQAMRDGDRSALEAIVAPDIRVWRNVTREFQSRADFLDLAVGLSRILPGFHYDGVRRRIFSNGFVQQHDIRGQGPSGGSFSVPACVIATVSDGQISAIEEYYDSAQDPR